MLNIARKIPQSIVRKLELSTDEAQNMYDIIVDACHYAYRNVGDMQDYPVNISIKCGNTMRAGRAVKTVTYASIRNISRDCLKERLPLEITINVGSIIFFKYMAPLLRFGRTEENLKQYRKEFFLKVYESACHEMIHAHQMVRGDFYVERVGFGWKRYWKNKSYAEATTRKQYLALPWETEAHTRDNIMARAALRSKRLADHKAENGGKVDPEFLANIMKPIPATKLI